METLQELLPVMARLGGREAIRWSNGFRSWQWTYSDLYAHAGAFANWLKEHEVHKGDRILIWGENRPEWVAAFWGCVARGVEAVPVDFRFSSELVHRIQRESRAKVLVYGSSVNVAGIPLERLHYDDISTLPKAPPEIEPLTGDDVVEIVYTSGTTGEPKGIVHRHRNICSNLEPFRREIDKYRKWATPFQPVRILNLLPLSHMFGQSQGLFIPLLLRGSAAFTGDLRPTAVMRFSREHRVSVIVSVPRILEVLEHEVQRRFDLPEASTAKEEPGPSQPRSSMQLRVLWGVAKKWWRYRLVHARFGWKFWAFIVGGARVEPELEEFWGKLGYLVIQGYGLTEASPVVAVNHPFSAKRGSLGKVVPGQDVTIAADGEIMVRGESVTGTRGEWLRTGDLGELDNEGRLYYRGRKKDLIVTPEGLNVHPEDVEAALKSIPGVADSAIVAAGELVHAALILSGPSVDPAAVVSLANQKLESHQRIRGWTVWPDEDFPRTASTMKVRRHEVARRIADGVKHSLPAPKSELDRILDSRPDTRLAEDLGLSSLERVELLAELESRHGVEIDEESFAQVRTIGELHTLAGASSSERKPDLRLSNWPLRLPVRLFRFALQHGVVFPLFRHYIPLTAAGVESLRDLSPPVIFAANHTSHLDTIALAAALPPRWRKRLAPAMSKDYFRAWFDKHELKTGLQYALARSVFNTYPLPQEMAGVRKALEFTGDLVQLGYCPLLYPEGRRTPDGKMHSFRPGVGMMAVQLQVPVVPIHIEGLYEVYSIHQDWPKPGPVRVTFGAPLRFPASTPIESVAKAIEQAIRGHKPFP